MKICCRTEAAFRFTCARLFEYYPNSCYFWTFTFISVPIDDTYAMEDFHAFSNRIKKHFPLIRGIRVAELHRSHGIHFHLIINMRIPIRRMKKIFYGSGHLSGWNRYLDFGRISVSKCDGGTVDYLADYLTKQYRMDNGFAHRRRWDVINCRHLATRTRDVEYDTLALWNRRELYGSHACGYGALMMISHYTNLWGDWRDWPEECRAIVWKQKGNRGHEWMREYKKNCPF